MDDAHTAFAYQEIANINRNEISLLCRCGNFISRRRDSFLPGTHVVICLQCGNISTEVERLDGTTVSVTPASHRDGGQ